MGEWVEVPFAEAIDFQEGPGIMAADFRDEGVPLIRLAGLERGGTVLAGCNFLDPSTAQRRWSHFALREGDILLSSSASLGRIAVVGVDAEGAIPYTGIIRMRPRDERVHAPFIRYLLEAPDFQRQAEIAGVGSVMRHFGPMHLRQMTVSLPPVRTQRRITEILGALDDKIELNRRLSETLQMAARALFKSMFVAKAGTEADGWRWCTIGDLAEVVGGSTPSTTEPRFWNGSHYWATPKDLAGLKTPVLLRTERMLTDAGIGQISSGLLPAGTVLMSSRAPIGYLAITEVPVAINQGFIAMKPRRGVSGLFLLHWAASSQDQILSRANGSTFLEISKANFRPIEVLAPSPKTMAAFDRVARPIHDRVVANERQIEVLVRMRDALLPRLLRGEASLPAAAGI